MKQVLTLCLVGSALALAACTSTDDGKVYPAPYSQERTAGGVGAPAAEPVFEHKMAK